MHTGRCLFKSWTSSDAQSNSHLVAQCCQKRRGESCGKCPPVIEKSLGTFTTVPLALRRLLAQFTSIGNGTDNFPFEKLVVSSHKAKQRLVSHSKTRQKKPVSSNMSGYVSSHPPLPMPSKSKTSFVTTTTVITF